MKKLLAVALFALSSLAFGATLNPIQLLNPAGSTSGQAIVSTGAGTAPAWGNVTATSLAAQAANTVLANATASSHSPIAFAMPSCSTSTSALQYTSGTGFTCYANSASLTGAVFTGNVFLGFPAPVFVLNDSSGTNTASIRYQNAGVNTWGVLSSSTSNNYLVNRYVSGSVVDTPLNISNSTGAVTMPDGITGSPISGSTGSFTTLAASGLITPSSTIGIKGTATNDSAQAGSVGEYQTASATSVSIPTSATATNVVSLSLPAGDWDVSGVIQFNPAGTTTVSSVRSSISTTPATLGTFDQQNYLQVASGFGAGLAQIVPTPTTRISLSTTTTVYLVAFSAFGTSTMTASGVIRARRPR